MNKRVYLFLGAVVLATVGVMPLSAIAQNAVTDSQQTTVKTSEVAAGSVAAKPGEKTDFNASEAKGVLPPTPATKKPAAPAPSYNWSGFYIGGHVGYAWGEGDTLFEPLPTAAQFVNLATVTLDPDPRGWTGGFQGGYNWQSGHFVGGGEADFSWSRAKGIQTVTPITQNNGTPFPGAGFINASQNTKWFSTLRGRAGVAVGRGLLYGTGGLAFAKVNYTADTDFRPVGTTQYLAAVSKTKRGWTVGYGFEFGISRHISWKGEYLYYRLGKETFTANATPLLPPFQVRYTFKASADTLNTGINFRF